MGKITILFEDWTLRAEEAHKSYVFSEKVIFLGAEQGYFQKTFLIPGR